MKPRPVVAASGMPTTTSMAYVGITCHNANGIIPRKRRAIIFTAGLAHRYGTSSTGV